MRNLVSWADRIPYRRHRPVPLAVTVAVTSFTACSQDPGSPTPLSTPDLGWIAPTTGDTLRGRIPLSAWADLGVPVTGVTFYADGEEVVHRDSPPWSATWHPTTEGGVLEPSTRRIRLEAEATGEGVRIRSAPVDVWFERDDRPVLACVLPSRTDWIELQPGRFLLAEGTDREDGAIDPARIVWTTKQGRRAYGTQFPTELLVSGPNEIQIRARDSAENESELSVSVHGFSYEGRNSAITAARDLRSALSALDLALLEELLLPEFELRACGSEGAFLVPDPLSRAEFLGALARLSDDTDLDRLEWAGIVALQGDESRSWAVVGWRQMGIESRRGDADWRTVGLAAELILRNVDGAWKVAVWREVDRGDGPGVLSLLRTNRL